ncbi:sigma-54 dependent transcriptional regulator [uncultured Thiohalocapsa sp.]|uniref:sigma-54-dependent transcriptional regulator n=1 Tax=uncultured Thiohalocapsa sp. TaxID=768990 RepID=UPI0025CB9F55|nr:sigma-54 dependent transcriptional regulator [uncultured Thiohalocapsa sp.]
MSQSSASTATALIVDDEPDILVLIGMTCAGLGVATANAGSLAAARNLLARQRFDLCLTDMRLPDGDGIALVREIAQHHPHTPVAMITAYGNMESAVAAMKAGAFDCVAKPLELHLLRDLIHAALKLRKPLARPDADADAGADADADGSACGLLGTSPQMREIRALIAKLARTQAPVLISGASGTGKELAARLVHSQGPRADAPFVPVNCGAIPGALVESELFGHRKGSFTDAVSDKQGLFQAAHGGTLFLDEIADLPLPMQVKLLRAIQQKSVRPVGAAREVAVDVRIISASHHDLKQAVDCGAFRQDLFYRINVIELFIPPLRERPEDIHSLADSILERIAAQAGNAPKRLGADARAALGGYDFPGNVRELENILERATALSEAAVLGVADLRLPFEPEAPAADDDDRVAELAPPLQLPPQPQPQATADTEPHSDADGDTDSAIGDQPLSVQLDEVEKKAILKALDSTRWNRTAAAKRLGLTPRALRYRLSKLQLD